MISHFLIDHLEYACPFVGRFTSLIETLLIFTKKELLSVGKLICFLFPFYLT